MFKRYLAMVGLAALSTSHFAIAQLEDERPDKQSQAIAFPTDRELAEAAVEVLLDLSQADEMRALLNSSKSQWNLDAVRGIQDTWPEGLTVDGIIEVDQQAVRAVFSRISNVLSKHAWYAAAVSRKDAAFFLDLPAKVAIIGTAGLLEIDEKIALRYSIQRFMELPIAAYQINFSILYVPISSSDPKFVVDSILEVLKLGNFDWSQARLALARMPRGSAAYLWERFHDREFVQLGATAESIVVGYLENYARSIGEELSPMLSNRIREFAYCPPPANFAFLEHAAPSDQQAQLVLKKVLEAPIAEEVDWAIGEDGRELGISIGVWMRWKEFIRENLDNLDLPEPRRAQIVAIINESKQYDPENASDER